MKMIAAAIGSLLLYAGAAPPLSARRISSPATGRCSGATTGSGPGAR